MRNLAKVTLTLIVMLFSTSCAGVDDATGLEALEEPLRETAKHVLRVSDPDLISSFRNVVSIYNAAVGD